MASQIGDVKRVYENKSLTSSPSSISVSFQCFLLADPNRNTEGKIDLFGAVHTDPSPRAQSRMEMAGEGT